MTRKARSSGWPARGVLALAAVVVLVPGVALAGFKSGSYTGNSEQPDNNGLLLTVPKNKQKVNIVFFEWSDSLIAPCGGGPGGTQFAGHKTRLKPSGKFNWVDEFGYGFVKGKFEGRKASGTARYTFEMNGCDSGVVEWEAERE
jgi:hypothetical protein